MTSQTHAIVHTGPTSCHGPSSEVVAATTASTAPATPAAGVPEPTAITRVPAAPCTSDGSRCTFAGGRSVDERELLAWCAGWATGVAYRSTDPAVRDQVATLRRSAQRMERAHSVALSVALVGIIVVAVAVVMDVNALIGAHQARAAIVSITSMATEFVCVQTMNRTERRIPDLQREAEELDHGRMLVMDHDAVEVPGQGPVQDIARHGAALALAGETGTGEWLERVRRAVAAQRGAEQILNDTESTDEQVRTARAALAALEQTAGTWRERWVLHTERQRELERTGQEAMETFERHDRALAREDTARALAEHLAVHEATGDTI